MNILEMIDKLSKIKPKNGIVYLDRNDFEYYVGLLFTSDIGMIMRLSSATTDEELIAMDKRLSEELKRKKTVLDEGKGIFFRGIPVEVENDGKVDR